MPGIADLGRLLSSIYSKQNRQARTSSKNLSFGKTVLDQIVVEMQYQILPVLTEPKWAGETTAFSDSTNTYYGDGEYFR